MGENLNTPDCIRTNSGRYINVFQPTPEMICIEDIAHALANQCRFGGHLPLFYTVAQHSIKTSRYVVGKHNRLAALMHDASEAYLLDIPSPIKRKLSNYKDIEDNLMRVIAKKFNFEYPLADEIKQADYKMLVYEWHTVMLSRIGFFAPIKMLFAFFTTMRRARAKRLFLKEFKKLSKLNCATV